MPMTNRARGRPSFQPTAANRLKVEELIAAKMSEDDVARAFGIATETLRKHFSEELKDGRARRRAEAVHLLFTAARKGNVAAAKALERITADETPTPRPKPLGKKEQAQLDAENAGIGTDWGNDLDIDYGMKRN